ncbi:MAG: CAP domain-containing protein [Patescibacteria group bacterium]
MNWRDRLKKYFIPGEHNEHQPHFLREGSVALLLLLVILVEASVIIPSFFVLPRNGFLAAVLPEALVSLTNEARLQAQVPILASNLLLAQAAQLKAEDMARRAYFSHASPEGNPPWLWLNRVGYDYSYAGENLAVNFFDSRDVVQAWQNSPTHQANLIHKTFTEIGIGVAAGTYQGRATLFVVQFFGRPASALGGGLAAVSAAQPRLNQVLGAAAAATKLSYWQVMATRLHTLSSKVYFALLGLVLLAFILNLFIKIRIQHPHIITNALLLILVLSGIIFLNQQIFTSKLQTSYLETSTVAR